LNHTAKAKKKHYHSINSAPIDTWRLFSDQHSINPDIAPKAMFLVERHFLSNSMQLADALIASTALTNGMPILTGNDKHYKVLTQLELKVFMPE